MANKQSDQDSSGLNVMEKDAIAYCILDFTFMVLTSVVGYKLLYHKFREIQRVIKRILVGFYTLVVAQAVASAVMVHLMFRNKRDQPLIAYYYARSYDWLFLSILLVLLFKFLFSLKRVEVQMNEGNKSVQ